MSKAATYIGLGVSLIFLLVCLITTGVSLNCLADKNTQCAQTAGIGALITGCLLLSSVLGVVLYNRRRGGM